MLDVLTGRSLQLHVGLHDRGYNHKHDDDDDDDDDNDDDDNDNDIDNDSMEINSSCRCWTSLLGALCSFMLVCMTEVTIINIMMMMMIMMMMIMIMTLIMTAWKSTPPAGAGRRYWALSAVSCWSA